MPKIGTKAPSFTLLNQRGEKVKLSDHLGSKVVLFAFPKANTSGCTAQACGFSEALPRFAKRGTVILGISPDAPAALARWKEQKGLAFDLLSDPDHKVLEKWGAWGEKSMYGKKYQGVIRSHWVVGEDGRILDERIKVSPADSVALAEKFLSEV